MSSGVPYYRFKEEGALVKVAGIKKGIVHRSEGTGGMDGGNLATTDMTIKDITPGCMGCLDHPRRDLWPDDPQGV